MTKDTDYIARLAAENHRLRVELANAELIVGILLARSGGEVRITPKEVVLAPRGSLTRVDDALTSDLIFRWDTRQEGLA